MSEKTYETEKDFYATNIFSENGHLYQMSYADNASYNSNYTLCLKTNNGWIIYCRLDSEKDVFNIKKYIVDDAHPSIKIDEIRKFASIYSGHWYSRKLYQDLTRSIMENVVHQKLVFENYQLKNIPLYVLDKIRQARVGSYFHDGRAASKEISFSNWSIPIIGHTLIFLSPFSEGFIIRPSGIYELSSILYSGGSSAKFASEVTSEIVQKILDSQETNYYENWENNKNNFSNEVCIEKLKTLRQENDIVISIKDQDWTYKIL